MTTEAREIGHGEVEFTSALELILSCVNAHVDVISAGLDRLSGAVKSLAMLFVDFVIKPLVDMYRSAAAMPYPFIEYFVTSLESIVHLTFHALNAGWAAGSLAQ